MQTIELDCAPGAARPDNFIGGVIAGTPLLESEPVSSKFFGNWTWAYDVPREVWEADVQPIIKPRIEALYNRGSIRYGSW